jgi:hypothetical protein
MHFLATRGCSGRKGLLLGQVKLRAELRFCGLFTGLSGNIPAAPRDFVVS